MKVLVVAKTRVGTEVCVGAIDAHNASVRLLDQHGHFVSPGTYSIGDIWDLTYTQAPQLIPPHLEDVLVVKGSKLGTQANLAGHLRARIKPWVGGVGALFEGHLGFTGNMRGYIEAPNLPSRSTWYWVPDEDLILVTDGQYYQCGLYQIKYVGADAPVPVIPRGTLVRVSLARWWKPRDAAPDFPDRCYLQVSGWYF